MPISANDPCVHCPHLAKDHWYCPSHHRMECTALIYRHGQEPDYCPCKDYGNAKEAGEKSRGPSVRYGLTG